MTNETLDTSRYGIITTDESDDEMETRDEHVALSWSKTHRHGKQTLRAPIPGSQDQMIIYAGNAFRMFSVYGTRGDGNDHVAIVQNLTVALVAAHDYALRRTLEE